MEIDDFMKARGVSANSACNDIEVCKKCFSRCKLFRLLGMAIATSIISVILGSLVSVAVSDSALMVVVAAIIGIFAIIFGLMSVAYVIGAGVYIGMNS